MLPHAHDAIPIKRGIDRNEAHRFHEGGRPNQAVEGISVMKRQMCKRLDVARFEWQEMDVFCNQVRRKKCSEWSRKRKLSQPILQSDFHEANWG